MRTKETNKKRWEQKKQMENDKNKRRQMKNDRNKRNKWTTMITRENKWKSTTKKENKRKFIRTKFRAEKTWEQLGGVRSAEWSIASGENNEKGAKWGPRRFPPLDLLNEFKRTSRRGMNLPDASSLGRRMGRWKRTRNNICWGRSLWEIWFSSFLIWTEFSGPSRPFFPPFSSSFLPFHFFTPSVSFFPFLLFFFPPPHTHFASALTLSTTYYHFALPLRLFTTSFYPYIFQPTLFSPLPKLHKSSPSEYIHIDALNIEGRKVFYDLCFSYASFK